MLKGCGKCGQVGPARQDNALLLQASRAMVRGDVVTPTWGVFSGVELGALVNVGADGVFLAMGWGMAWKEVIWSG